MSLIISAFILLISFSVANVISTFALFNIIGCLLRLPYVLFCVCTDKIKPAALLLCVVPTIIYSIGLCLLIFGIQFLFDCFKYSRNFDFIVTRITIGASIGFLFSLIMFCGKVFSPEINREFESKVSKFKKTPPNLCIFCGSKKNVHRFGFYGGGKGIHASGDFYICEKCVPVCPFCGGFVKNKLIKAYLEQIKIDEQYEECDSIEFCDCRNNVIE